VDRVGGNEARDKTKRNKMNDEILAKLTEALRNIKFHALHDTGGDEKSAEINRSRLRQVREIACEALSLIDEN